MAYIPHKSLAILVALLLMLTPTFTLSKTYVQVMNQLGDGLCLNVHCQSRDDDLGYHVLDNGGATSWSFDVNFWGTTLFYCDVQWGESEWYHFDAYDAGKDGERCRTICRWMIGKEGKLYGYDERTERWRPFPLIAEG